VYNLFAILLAAGAFLAERGSLRSMLGWGSWSAFCWSFWLWLSGGERSSRLVVVDLLGRCWCMQREGCGLTFRMG
jgi:hypothetical protein